MVKILLIKLNQVIDSIHQGNYLTNLCQKGLSLTPKERILHFRKKIMIHIQLLGKDIYKSTLKGLLYHSEIVLIDGGYIKQKLFITYNIVLLK